MVSKNVNVNKNENYETVLYNHNRCMLIDPFEVDPVFCDVLLYFKTLIFFKMRQTVLVQRFVFQLVTTLSGCQILHWIK